MLRIALCDDNTTDLSSMESILKTYRTNHFTDCDYCVFHSGFELMTALGNGKRFDVYCLDIIMPKFSGIALGKEIRSCQKNAQIIFFTSSPEFALESYSVKAANYILKPVTFEKFSRAMDDVLDQIHKEEPQTVILKSSEGILKILLSSLLYVEAMGRNTIYHTVSGRTITCPQKFSAACDSLMDYSCFLKSHRSYLVNMNYIDVIRSTEITLQSSIKIPVAQGKVKEIKELYLAFQMEDFK